ncbi:MAG: single-stranded-DNA-specific exonuclease RecJ [Polyangiales bacterium]
MANPGYRVKTMDPMRAAEFGRAWDLGPATAQILLQRGWEEREAGALEWLDPKLARLTAPDAMADRMKAAERLAEACRKGQRISIFGDYDVDGTTSAAILADILEELGAEVHAFVANRFQGGYGFSGPALDRCLAVKPDLIITCDCGSSDHPRIQRSADSGVPVIVVDHHLVPKETLPAHSFLNPHRPECGFPYKGLCSAGLALSLGAAVRQVLGAKLDVRRWLDLVALGTVADVAPLDGDNRALVRAGLRLLASDKARPGVQALRAKAGLRAGNAMGATEIAFRLAPRLNAAGRLGDPTVTLKLLRARTLQEAHACAEEIESLNNERKAATKKTTDEAFAQVEELYGSQPTHGVVVAAKGWHRGVVGITAARIVDHFDVPAVVIALDENGHGSGRTPDGFDLYTALSKCKEHFLRFGGHQAAAGLTMETDKIPAFREAFSAVAPRPEAGVALPLVDIELDGRFPLPSVRDLMRLEPMGEGNAEPVFALRDAHITEARTLSGGQHLKLRLRVGDRYVSAFGANLAHRLEALGDRVTVVGTLRPDHWRGGENLELSVRHLFSETPEMPVEA